MLIIFLLSNRSKDKLLIIHLLSYPNWSTNKLALKLNRKKRDTKDLIRELKNDAYKYLNKIIDIKIEPDGEIKSNSPEEMLQFFYSLKLSYLEETNEFNILHLFLKKPTLSLVYISNNLFVSHSYARRVIKKLNTFLHPFHFQIIEKNGVFELKGNELSICLFLYVIMNDTYNTVPWPYKTNDLYKNINFHQSLDIVLTILSSRKKYFPLITPLSKKSHWIISNMKDTHNFIPNLKRQNIAFQNILSGILIEEYFIFFTHICAPQVIPKEIKIALGKSFLQAPTDISFSKNLSHKIIEKFHLDYEGDKHYLLIYYLTVLECFYDIMQETTILFEDLIFPPLYYSLSLEKLQSKKLMQFLNNHFLEESRTDLLQNQILKQYFCGLIYTILQIEKPPKINIYISLTKDLTARDLVQTRLETIYNSNTVFFVSCTKQADLIVTDSLNFDQKKKNTVIYFNTILKEDQWELLLQKINQVLLSKISTQEKDSE